MSQSDLINKPELSNTTKENHLIEILREIQATPKEYWPNSQLEIDAQQQILNQQHQALKELTKEWLEEGEQEEQTETWEYLRQKQEIDDNPF